MGSTLVPLQQMTEPLLIKKELDLVRTTGAYQEVVAGRQDRPKNREVTLCGIKGIVHGLSQVIRAQYACNHVTQIPRVAIHRRRYNCSCSVQGLHDGHGCVRVLPGLQHVLVQAVQIEPCKARAVAVGTDFNPDLPLSLGIGCIDVNDPVKRREVQSVGSALQVGLVLIVPLLGHIDTHTPDVLGGNVMGPFTAALIHVAEGTGRRLPVPTGDYFSQI